MIIAKKIINFDAEVYIQDEKLVTKDLLSLRQKLLIKTTTEINANLRPKVIALDSYDNGFIIGKVFSNVNDTIIGIVPPLRYLSGSEIELIVSGQVLDPGLTGIINQVVYCNLSGELTTVYSSAQPSLKIGKIVKLNPTIVDINVGEESSGLDVDSIINEDSNFLDNAALSYELAFRTLQAYTKGTFFTNDVVPSMALQFRDVAYGAGKFVITAGQQSLKYENGVWTASALFALPSIGFIIYFNGSKFVVIGDNFIRTSTDGLTWGVEGSVPNANWIAAAPNIIVSSSGVSYVARLTGPNTWTSGTFPGGFPLKSVAVLNNIAIAVAGTNLIAKSIDNGANWASVDTTPLFGQSRNWQCITSDGLRYFVAVASSGTNRLIYSTDGINWTEVAIQLKSWYTITYVPEIKSFIGSAIENTIFITKNFKDFVYHTLPTSNYFAGTGKIASNENGFLVCPYQGSSTTIFKSAEL